MSKDFSFCFDIHSLDLFFFPRDTMESLFPQNSVMKWILKILSHSWKCEGTAHPNDLLRVTRTDKEIEAKSPETLGWSLLRFLNLLFSIHLVLHFSEMHCFLKFYLKTRLDGVENSTILLSCLSTQITYHNSLSHNTQETSGLHCV